MEFFNSKQISPLALTLKFILFLTVSYIIYFTFVRDYGTLLMIVSTNIVAFIFDMNIVNSGSYLEDIKLVSNIGLQNSVTHEIAYAELALPKMIVNKIMGIITSTVVILALLMLLVRSYKTLAVAFTIMITVHIFSISVTIAYFMLEVSPQSPILLAYIKALGVTQLVGDITYILSGLSFYYLKFFTPLFISYYIWETDGHKFTEVIRQTNKQSNSLLSKNRI